MTESDSYDHSNASAISFIRGEPNLGPLEDAYRVHTLGADVGQGIVIAWIYIVAVISYAFIDYQLFGPSKTMLGLYAARAAMIAFSLTSMLIMKRTASYRLVDWLALIWTTAIACLSLYAHLIHPNSFYSNIGVDVILVIVFYTVIPNRFHFRIIPALLLSLGDIIFLSVVGSGANPIDVRSSMVALLLVNLIGIVISVNLFTYRRRQFKAQYDEQRARQEIERLITIDSLTQVLNRRRFMELAESELQRFHRYHHPFSLLLMDLDNFKRINDSFGHSAGDIALKEFASLAGSLVRRGDMLARLGGEEFGIILPETLSKYALQLADRICQQCERMKVQTRSGIIRITISIGVTEVGSKDASPEDTLHRADQALYYVKGNGRNGIHLIRAG